MRINKINSVNYVPDVNETYCDRSKVTSLSLTFNRGSSFIVPALCQPCVRHQGEDDDKGTSRTNRYEIGHCDVVSWER